MTAPTLAPAPADLDALRREITILREQRAALAQILDAVPVAAHNAAVLAAGVPLLTYVAAMEAARAE